MPEGRAGYLGFPPRARSERAPGLWTMDRSRSRGTPRDGSGSGIRERSIPGSNASYEVRGIPCVINGRASSDLREENRTRPRGSKGGLSDSPWIIDSITQMAPRVSGSTGHLTTNFKSGEPSEQWARRLASARTEIGEAGGPSVRTTCRPRLKLSLDPFEPLRMNGKPILRPVCPTVAFDVLR